MISREDSHAAKINPDCRERFLVYVKYSWEIFKATIQDIENVALNKKTAKDSEKVAIAVDAASIIAGTVFLINL